MTTLETYQTKFQRAQGRQATLQQQQSALAEEARTVEADQLALEQAQVFIQTVAQATQEQLRFHIQDIVQLALDTCFPGKYQFNVVFEIKRGKTEARLSFLQEGQEIAPMDASGGGAVDLTAFALRLAAWTLSRTRNVMILDEPFRNLSKDLQPLAGEIMREMSQQLQLQVLMVTHNPDMIEVSDRVFSVSMKPQDGWNISRVVQNKSDI